GAQGSHSVTPPIPEVKTGGRGFLPQENITLLKSVLKEGRLEEAVAIIKEKIEDMDKALLNIAITGESGTGKSTFINAFRGTSHEGDDAANTGVVETTTEIIPYEHPKFPNVKLWDLPGIGTPNFQPKLYLEQVNFNSYDFFFIVSSTRFRDNDANLAQEIRKMGKKFYFVRTKIDSDLDNERKAKPRSFKEENVLQQIQENCLQNLRKVGIEDPQVFLISNFELASFDFPKLQDILVEELPAHKRHVFLLSLPNISEAAINQKKAALQDKIWLKALKSGLRSTVPFVGIIKEDSIAKLQKTLKNYQSLFGVDDASLRKIAQKSNRSLEDLKKLIKSPDLLTVKKDESLSEKLVKYAEVVFSIYNIQLHFLNTVADDAKILLSKIWEPPAKERQTEPSPHLSLSPSSSSSSSLSVFLFFFSFSHTDGSLLTKDTLTWIQSALEEGRLGEVASRIQETLEASENIPLNIAVTGESGSGKSTFINDSASTGVVETTKEATPYKHPKYPNVNFWDLPGIGIPDFHPETYLNKVNIDQYDFFIIFSASRFTVNHVKLVQEIRKMKKKFYFVRSMVDKDLENERKAKPSTFSQEKVLQIIRDYCLKYFNDECMSEAPVFLVSNFDLSVYDFPKLEETLIKDLPACKRHAFLLALPDVSKAVIDRKKAALRERIWLQALKTGALATIPVAGFFLNDLVTLNNHLKHYRKVFGMDDESLLQVARRLGRPVEEIKVPLKSLDLEALIKEESTIELLLKLVEGFCSANGIILSAGFHFGKTYYTQLLFLNTVADDAKILLQKNLALEFGNYIPGSCLLGV
uniref:IRG-type G domain-containing protein n=1 Tax=Monodelphis domestica TaxID=13616 RepID=A0A5F8H6V2_MONDO